eukprot:3159483-Pyramimonas_sp.AAC.1
MERMWDPATPCMAAKAAVCSLTAACNAAIADGAGAVANALCTPCSPRTAGRRPPRPPVPVPALMTAFTAS